jgi:hypothetical protein
MNLQHAVQASRKDLEHDLSVCATCQSTDARRWVFINESDWLKEGWQQAIFWSNYKRLLMVRKRYDSTGLFNCWMCVGWIGYDE